MSRGIEAGILPRARALGSAVVACGVLSRGLLGGRWSKERGLAARDFRASLPRFQGEKLDRNLALVEAVRAIAERRGVSVVQMATAWVIAQGRDIIPLIGARRPDHLSQALRALDLDLSAGDLAAIEKVLPAESVAGSRYPLEQMAHLDSEQG